MKYFYLMLFFTLILFAQEHENEEHHDELNVSPSLFKEIGITFTKLEHKVLEKHVKSYGEVIPSNNGFSEVGTLVSGRVGKIHVKLGQFVNKGDKLFEVSSLEVMELMDDYFSTKAEFKRAEKNYSRLLKLRKESIGSDKSFFISESDFEKSKAKFESADRKIHAIGFTDHELKKLTESTKHSSTMMNIKAPISGVITELNVKNGKFVNSEHTLAKILNSKKMWARLHVYEKNISFIKSGSKIELTCPSNPLVKTSGTIFSKSNSFMKGKKSIEVIAEIDNTKHLVLGSNINAIIFNSDGKTSTVLPDQSVIEEKGEHFVFIRKSDSEFEKRKVIVGKQVGSFVQILNGVNKNESVVENGSFYLKALSKGEELGGHAH